MLNKILKKQKTNPPVVVQPLWRNSLNKEISSNLGNGMYYETNLNGAELQLLFITLTYLLEHITKENPNIVLEGRDLVGKVPLEYIDNLLNTIGFFHDHRKAYNVEIDDNVDIAESIRLYASKKHSNFTKNFLELMAKKSITVKESGKQSSFGIFKSVALKDDVVLIEASTDLLPLWFYFVLFMNEMAEIKLEGDDGDGFISVHCPTSVYYETFMVATLIALLTRKVPLLSEDIIATTLEFIKKDSQDTYDMFIAFMNHKFSITT